MNSSSFLNRCVSAGLAAGVLVGLAVMGQQAFAAGDPAIVHSEIIVPNPPFASSHASTIVETPDGLVAAWFGGSEEGAPDVSIWLSRNEGGTGWSAPEEVANGSDLREFRRYPCWNPVLFLRKNGQLLLFYKVGPSPSTWWGMVRMSTDNGKTWVKASRLPAGYVGPVRNKPIEIADGVLLCGSSSEDKGWRVRMEWAKDPFGIWSCGPYLNAAFTMAVIQPTILRHGSGTYQLMCRSKQGRVMTCWSQDNGQSWSPMDRTPLPNPNSAIDGVTLDDGRQLLIYNHTDKGRGVLNAAISTDGKMWEAVCELENEPDSEFSYPAAILTKDGFVHVTYTWKRERIKHVVLDPSRFNGRVMVDGRWPTP
ncbi:MAG TPA: exo-alpha-sialidase [Verrucomicrobiota bacterium]|nr:exo-alpha-sialidase [Verrucomicrobiota bacterium]